MARFADGPTVHVPLPEVAEIVVTRREAPGVVTHEIAWPDWTGCAPGQFNMLGLPDLGEVASCVSGGTAGGGPVRHTIRAAGPVSDALTHLGAGASVTIRGPYGTPWPLEVTADLPVLVVGWEAGLAALRPLVQHVARHAEGGLPVRLVIGAHTPHALVSWRDYDGWRARGVDLVLTVDRAPQGWPWHVAPLKRFTQWPDASADAQCCAFVCGPVGMMRATARHLVDRGVDASRIFVGLFDNMPCGTGQCGRCRRGDLLACRDGPVLNWREGARLLRGRDG